MIVVIGYSVDRVLCFVDIKERERKGIIFVFEMFVI